MSIPLHKIIERLKQENLHGPTSTSASTFPKKFENAGNPWRYTGEEYQDLDTRDPRWFELFMEYFIDAKNEVADDILFFVRQFVPSNKSSTGSINELDPVFVRRRVAGQTPNLNDIIDWKQSFFLNLICQLPCTLTVAVCRKIDEVIERGKNVTDLHTGRRDSGNSNNANQKSPGMIARKRITNKVFASPYKSRMDVKDAITNECSFPLVYYTINDYEDKNLHLSITSGEYLCAELSVTIPNDPTSLGYRRATDLVAEITLDQDTDPFPLPPGYSKLILFQGAVAFKALSDVYQQKGVAALTQMRNGWGRKDITVSSPRTEYVLMKGPHGKGQCQVTIQQPNAPPLFTPNNTVLGFLKDTIKYQIGSPGEEKSVVPAPDELDCSLTYINMAWQSISIDLMQDNNHSAS